MYGKLDEFNFRQLNHKYLLVLNDTRNNLVVGNAFPHEEGDNAYLVYGYIDNQAGLSFEVLCMANVSDDGHVSFRETSKTTAFKMRYDSILGTVFSMDYRPEFDQFESRVATIHEFYHSSPMTEAFREDIRFDACRNNQYPDDVVVIFLKEGVKPEGIWCKLADAKGDKVYGRMMNEPYADFGPHNGDLVEITLVNVENELKAVALF